MTWSDLFHHEHTVNCEDCKKHTDKRTIEEPYILPTYI